MTGDVPQNLVARTSSGRDQWPALEDIADKPRRAAIVREGRGQRLLFARAVFERLAAFVSAGIVSARARACAHFSKGRRQFSNISAVSSGFERAGGTSVRERDIGGGGDWAVAGLRPAGPICRARWGGRTQRRGQRKQWLRRRSDVRVGGRTRAWTSRRPRGGGRPGGRVRERGRRRPRLGRRAHDVRAGGGG